ncbi:hypothetical protein [Tenacibaculum caenipelagi]|uniref:Type VI secretion system (T6SS) EvfL/ImpJ/VasE family protein n=1 Tax=Tenacibaculum caenipelagi TaxID=1325435 RepID=A0A4R6TLA8_9FLAO|nr:hypothetical protein [Tenacibaculum caenipelagi]TDQ30357.1 hypothetical protein DFQ07_0700 [Tenacibaculum caenipelagi]
MNKKMNHLPVNWTDGVKISAEHFFKSYNNVIETIKDYSSVCLKSYEYGLTEKTSNFENLQLEALTDGDNSLIIKLKSCNAITQGGYRIIYHPNLYGEDSPSVTLKTSDFDKTESEEFYVILTLSPFEYLPVGMPDPEVLPLHHPHVLPKLKLHTVPVSKINTSFLKEHFLVVSKILWVNGLFSIDQDYIPPVVNLSANEQLEDFSKGLLQVLISVKNYTVKVFKKNNEQKNNNKLVINTFSICEILQEYYSDNIFNLENLSFKRSPIYLVDRLVVLANKLSICLSIMNDKEKEELLQYYYQWTDIKPSYILDIIADTVNVKYNHIEISETFGVLNKFVTMLERIFKKMSELEYIGQRKDNIVINEESISQFSGSKGRNTTWSIID